MLDAAHPAARWVVLAPGDSGIYFTEAVGHGLEGDFNQADVELRAGRQAGGVAACRSSTTARSRLRGAINVDDEGSPARNNTLIENGTVGHMHDRLSAKHYGIKPTGNGRRDRSPRCRCPG
jgi:TldD protein